MRSGRVSKIKRTPNKMSARAVSNLKVEADESYDESAPGTPEPMLTSGGHTVDPSILTPPSVSDYVDASSFDNNSSIPFDPHMGRGLDLCSSPEYLDLQGIENDFF